MAVPAWIAASDEEKDGDLVSPLRGRERSGTWDEKFPLTVCVREWRCERSKTAFIRKKKNAHVRIELKRKPTKGIGLHGYRDLEAGAELGSKGWSDIIEKGDTVLFNVLKSKSKSEKGSTAVISGDSSISSNTVSTMGFRGPDDFKNAPPDMRDNWKLKVSIPLSNVNLTLDNSKCVATYSGGSVVKSNILHFSSPEEARTFLTFVRDTKHALRKISESAIKSDIGTEITPSAPLKFLIEIVSATDLKVADRTSSDPFVIVKFGGKKIHTTSVIKKNLDPIWTVKTNSLFIFTLWAEDFYNHELFFEVQDKDFIAGDSLGQCLLSPKKLIKEEGKRIQMKLKYIQTDEDAQGVLAIRCRRAAESDESFVQRAASNSLVDRNYFRNFVTPRHGKQRQKVSLRRKKVEKNVTYHLVRPIDEQREAMWMTSEEIDTAARAKSDQWIEVGSGNVGNLYVEVIGCDGLINKDSGLLGDKTDAFATIVFEDSIVTTDVVSDCLSPRFLPWTRRAFKFNMSGMSSPLFIGVFDFDALNGVDDHDPIGRISIPLHKFTPRTTYMVSYDLYNSHEVSNRQSDGSITLRIRLELNRGQRGLFFNLQSDRIENSIHLDNKKNYAHAHYTIRGENDVTQYEMKTFFSLVEELLEYQNIIFPIQEALKTLILWRSHYPFKFLCCRFHIPLHSMVMFSFAIVIVEFPDYIPSLFFASIAWLMLALLENERKRPSPWDRPPSYGSLLLRFITNRARPVNIERYQNSLADEEYMLMLEQRNEAYKKEMEKILLDLNANAEVQGKMETERRANLSKSKRRRLPKIQLFKAVLEPIQLALLPIVNMIRGVKAIAKWDRFYVAFWITTISILCSIGSIASVYFFKDLIYGKVLLWVKRVVLYGALSPLNKCVDAVYFSKFDKMTPSEKEALHQERLRRKRNRFEGEFLAQQMKLEDYKKEEAFKIARFGPNILTVPNLTTPERYESIPKAESYAVHSRQKPEEELSASTLVCSLRGQTMDMTNIIPADYATHVKYPLAPKEESPLGDNYHPDSKTPLFWHSNKTMVGGTFKK